MAALPTRVRTVGKIEARRLRIATRWLVTSRETQNFTYDLQPHNLEHLAWFIAAVSKTPIADCRRWTAEVLDDAALRHHIHRNTTRSTLRGIADRDVRYGRRVGWYALTRALRPALVVETGTDKGLGSCVFAAALLRNGVGRLIMLDTDPAAGYLISGDYATVTTQLVGDSITHLKGLEGPVDLFLHDSNHDPDYEMAEFDAVAGYLSAGSVILSDNSHWSPSLPLWAERTGRRFLYFQEVPADHWYAGGGIGAARC